MKKVEFPEECCGVCKFSHMDGQDLECWGNMPLIVGDGEGGGICMRKAIIEPTDHICWAFKPKNHA